MKGKTFPAAILSLAFLISATAPGDAVRIGERAIRPKFAVIIPIKKYAEELMAVLNGAAWIHKPGQKGPVLYVVTFRTCGPCIEFKESELDGLLAVGVDVRFIPFASGQIEDGEDSAEPGERAMIAELAKTRSWDLYMGWYDMKAETYYATQPLPPSADDDSERTALIANGRKLVDAVEKALTFSRVELGFPAFFWRDKDGKPQTEIGYSPQSFGAVRKSLFGQ